MWQSLHDAWWRLATQSEPRSFSDALACRVLQTGAVAYRAAVAVRNTAYDRGWVPQVRLPCRVVSIGNLTVGGTGKTACVELITTKLLALGRRVAVLSRGYGGRRGDYWLRWEAGRLLVNGGAEAAPDGLADEPQLLAKHLAGVPIFVGARRDRTGRAACQQCAVDTVVLDDGFQHRRLRRDCEIVLVRARMPFGGWPVLPRGPMREPLTSLKRAHVIMLTKADEALETLGAWRERLRAFNPNAALVAAMHVPTSLLDGFTGQRHEPHRVAGLRVGLLSSIGDPEGFEVTVRRLHALVSWHHPLPDHHRYRPTDWDALTARVRASRLDAVVTTEKDWVRLSAVADGGLPGDVPLWVLGIRMTIHSGEDLLDARLAGLNAR